MIQIKQELPKLYISHLRAFCSQNMRLKNQKLIYEGLIGGQSRILKYPELFLIKNSKLSKNDRGLLCFL